MKFKMMDLWMQIEGTKLVFTLNFSVLDFFKFAFNTDFCLNFQNFLGEVRSGGERGGGGMPPDPGRNLFFFH